MAFFDARHQIFPISVKGEMSTSPEQQASYRPNQHDDNSTDTRPHEQPSGLIDRIATVPTPTSDIQSQQRNPRKRRKFHKPTMEEIRGKIHLKCMKREKFKHLPESPELNIPHIWLLKGAVSYSNYGSSDTFSTLKQHFKVLKYALLSKAEQNKPQCPSLAFEAKLSATQTPSSKALGNTAEQPYGSGLADTAVPPSNGTSLISGTPDKNLAEMDSGPTASDSAKRINPDSVGSGVAIEPSVAPEVISTVTSFAEDTDFSTIGLTAAAKTSQSFAAKITSRYEAVHGLVMSWICPERFDASITNGLNDVHSAEPGDNHSEELIEVRGEDPIEENAVSTDRQVDFLVLLLEETGIFCNGKFTSKSISLEDMPLYKKTGGSVKLFMDLIESKNFTDVFLYHHTRRWPRKERKDLTFKGIRDELVKQSQNYDAKKPRRPSILSILRQLLYPYRLVRKTKFELELDAPKAMAILVTLDSSLSKEEFETICDIIPGDGRAQITTMLQMFLERGIFSHWRDTRTEFESSFDEQLMIYNKLRRLDMNVVCPICRERRACSCTCRDDCFDTPRIPAARSMTQPSEIRKATLPENNLATSPAHLSEDDISALFENSPPCPSEDCPDYSIHGVLAS